MLNIELASIQAHTAFLKKFGGNSHIIMSVNGTEMLLAASDSNNNTMVAKIELDEAAEESIMLAFNGKKFLDIIESLTDEDIEFDTTDTNGWTHATIKSDSGKRQISVTTEIPFEIPVIDENELMLLYEGEDEIGEAIKGLLHVESRIANRATMSALISDSLIFTFNTSEVAAYLDPFPNNERELDEDADNSWRVPDFNKEFLWVFSQLSMPYKIYRGQGKTFIQTEEHLFMLINMVTHIALDLQGRAQQRLDGVGETISVTVNRTMMMNAIQRIRTSRGTTEANTVNIVVFGEEMAIFWIDETARLIEFLDVTTDSEDDAVFRAFAVSVDTLYNAMKVYGSAEQMVIKIAEGSIVVEIDNYKDVIATQPRVRLPSEIQEDLADYTLNDNISFN